MCGKITNVRKDTHIDFRDHYVMGIGQMCYSCYFGAYIKPDDPMDEQSMKELVRCNMKEKLAFFYAHYKILDLSLQRQGLNLCF